MFETSNSKNSKQTNKGTNNNNNNNNNKQTNKKQQQNKQSKKKKKMQNQTTRKENANIDETQTYVTQKIFQAEVLLNYQDHEI